MQTFDLLTRYVRETPWAIMPEMLAVIADVVAFRAAGGRLSAEEIRERIGVESFAQRPARATVKGAVAVLGLRGVIAHRVEALSDVSAPAGTSTQLFTQRFREALADDGIGKILIDVDSPGGSVDGVPELADEIFRSRGRKPVVAVVNTLGASAAYWIASAADEIVMTPSGQVGSIGVFTAHEDKSAFFEKMGIKTTLISAGQHKAEGNPFEPLDDDARDHLQSRVDAFYGMFVDAVARGRGVEPVNVRGGFGRGRMVGAAHALEVGMIDRVATFDETLAGLFADEGEGPVDARRHRHRVSPAHHVHCSVFTAGENLGRRLNQLIDEKAVKEDRDRADIIEEMADEAGISTNTVNQILNGTINCPPIERLEAFARVLDTTVEDLVSEAEKDGCDYSTDDDEARARDRRPARHRHSFTF